MSRIVKEGAFVIDEQKYRLSPRVLKIPENDTDEQEIDYEQDDTLDNAKMPEFDLQSMLDDAKIQADDIVKSAKNEYEQVLRDAYDSSMEIMQNAKNEGFSEGYKDGYDKAYAEVYEQRDELLADAISIKNDSINRYSELVQNAEAEIVDLVMQISYKILMKNAEEDKSVIFELVRSAISKITYTETLKVYVSPHDYPNLIRVKNEILPLLERIDDIEILEDKSMQIGDCRVETDSGDIDSGIRTQFEFVKQTFEGLLQTE